MAISKARKQELVALYGDILTHATGFIVTEYRGLGVKQLDALRTRLREVDGGYVITKNTLFKIALQNADWPVPEDLLVGPVATAFADGNMPGVAKAMLDFQKDYPEILVIKGGVMLGNTLSAQEIQTVSELPTLDELRAQLAGMVVQPAQGLVNVLQAATGGVVNVIQAYLDEHGDNNEEAA